MGDGEIRDEACRGRGGISHWRGENFNDMEVEKGSEMEKGAKGVEKQAETSRRTTCFLLNFFP